MKNVRTPRGGFFLTHTVHCRYSVLTGIIYFNLSIDLFFEQHKDAMQKMKAAAMNNFIYSQ